MYSHVYTCSGTSFMQEHTRVVVDYQPHPNMHAQDPISEYTFAKELGSGHYGTTYEIRRNSDGQEFACKVINKLQRHCRFKDVMREVEIQRALLDCPYVCKLYEVWEWQNYIYLVEELCRGGELFDVIIGMLLGCVG